jgi:hypothetical protein
MTKPAAALWRRLDAPGHDACRLEQVADGWQLAGTAAFMHEGTPAMLTYRIACDDSWSTSNGLVRGWVGSRQLDFHAVRTPLGRWTLNNEPVAGLEACVDLDFNFTPATNLHQLRRIALAEGDSTDVPVAWLDPFAGTLTLLRQRYTRRGRTTYWYEASVGYSGLLEVARNGFVRRYPELWEMEG